MRTVLLGLAGLIIAACGQGEGADQKTYGAKPSERETVEQTGGEGGETPANQEITGTPTGMSGGPEGGTDGGPSDGSMTQNQSRPMQAAQ
jgi:hypothetical protein